MSEIKKNRKILIVLMIIFILILASMITLLYMRSYQGKWVCENGQWVKYGNPNQPMPDQSCGKEEQDKIDETEESAEEDIVVFSPEPNEKISSPLKISGEARGTWYFEGDFPIRLITDKGEELASGFATAQGEWMTEDFVPFESMLTFDTEKAKSGSLILIKDNPSDIRKYDDEITVPVKFKQAESEKMIVKVYFSNTYLDPEVTCEKVFSVKRQIEPTKAVARAAIEELLKGPTSNEREDRYQTSINEGVKLNSIKIEGSTAYADFNEKLEYQVGGSCRVSLISKQIEETLKQFDTIDEVVISVEGRTEDILQP